MFGNKHSRKRKHSRERKHSHKRFLVLGLFLIFLLAACGGGDGEMSIGSGSYGDDGADYDMAYDEAPRVVADGEGYYEEAEFRYDTNTVAQTAAGSANSGGNPAPSPPMEEPATTEAQTQIERLIIRNGYMSIDVADTEGAIGEIAALADTMGGWVVSTEINQYDVRKSGNIIIRVEAQQFEAAMTQIREMAVEVNNESTSGQDVTEEYVDLNARLGNLEATAERVRGFLAEARNTEEALAVSRELSLLESEIESLKGRLNYLSQSAAYSTINVSVFPDEAGEPIEVAGWRPEGVAKDAVESLVATLQTLVNGVIWLGIYIVPLLVLVLLPLYLIIRFVRRRRRAARAAA